MLRVYVCVACEKVILAADGVASLIGLFGKIIASVPAEIEIPKNAVVPKEWALFSAWDAEPGDELKEFILCTQILYPDQTPFGEITRKQIAIERDKRSQVTGQVLGFPIGQVGFYTIRTWIEESQRTVFGPIEFKIELEIARQKQIPMTP